MAIKRAAIAVPNAASSMMAFPLQMVGGITHENLHVVPNGHGGYIIDNSPFYAYDISYRDVVSARPDGARLLFDAVLKRGGHSTYRVKLPAGAQHDYFLTRWPAFEALGCSYEGSSANLRRLYAIDLPPSTDVYEVYRLLEVGEAEGAWEFEEAHYFHPGADDPMDRK